MFRCFISKFGISAQISNEFLAISVESRGRRDTEDGGFALDGAIGVRKVKAAIVSAMSRKTQDADSSAISPVDQIGRPVSGDLKTNLAPIPIHEEVFEPIVHEMVRGRVVVRRRIETIETQVPVDVRREHATVERRSMNRPIETAPAPYWDGHTLVVPVIEEEIVVQRRLILREELRVTIESETIHDEIPTTTRREVVDVTEEPSHRPTA